MSSTSSSTSSTPTPTAAHRASTRRGSISAPDPYGRHLELNMSPSRTTSSKLSIVRVLSLPPITLDPPPSSHRRQHQHQHQHQHHLHRRSTSSSSSSSHHHPQQQKPDSPRLSFASASFAAPGSPTLPPSPGGTSPRPSSPTHLRRASSVSITSSRTRLTPDQLIALAHEASSPRANPLTSPAAAQQQHPTAPANFTELAPDVYLPFVNRAEEVSSLLASPGCARLLALLFQTFPPSSSSSDDDDKKAQDDQALLTSDSRKWTTAQLRFWLTSVDRPSASDAVWVSKARACVLEHSELIWQRLKGALGVPPELDVDEEEEGGGEDVMASLPSALSFSSAGGSSGPGSSPPAPVEPEPRFTNTADDITDEDLLHPEEGEMEEDQHDLTSSLTFEPIFAGTSPAAPHDLPPTRPGAHSLADCVEEEDEDGAERECEPAPAVAQDVRGLVIRTVPSSPSIFAGMGFGVGPMSPGSTFSPFALGASATSPPTAGGGGVSPAVSAIALPEPLSMSSSRARSASNASSRASHYSYRPASSTSMSSRRHSYASSDAGGGYYQAVGERGPGNPLFPSSFARLALGPTLSANNPALRAPASMPPANRFGPGLRGRLGMGAGAPSEYAVTLASESSVGA